VTRHYSIKLYASKAIVTRIGGDYDLLGLALQIAGAADSDHATSNPDASARHDRQEWPSMGVAADTSHVMAA
jgi:hypothetical protein